MQRVSEVMTRDVRFVSPQESLQRAAQMMDELNVGSLPVCEGERLVGMVTDRDLTVRGVAAGKTPDAAHVDEVMSTDVRTVFEDQPLDDVMTQMADSQIRRIPVVSHDARQKLVGIVSLGDVATKTSGGAQKREVEDVVETVSTPSRPPGQPSAAGSDTVPGPGIPRAGQSGIGVAGASGEGGGSQADKGSDGARRDFGVSGQDLTGDGLPPD